MRSLLLPFLLSSVLPFAQAPDEALQGEALEAARATVTQLAKHLEDVERLHGDFVQEQHTLLMDKPLISKGRMSLRGEPGCLLLELKEPKHVLLRSDSTSHQVWYPAEKKAERYLFESNDLAKTLLSILTVDVAQLEKAFVITGHEHGKEEDALVLRLRDESKRRVVDHLRIVIEPKQSTLNGVSFVNSDGEKTVLRLNNVRYVTPESTKEERALERDVFDTPLPEDVRLIVHSVPSRDSKAPPK